MARKEVVAMTASMMVLIVSQCSYFIIFTVYHLFFKVGNISKATQKLQWKFFLALIMQATIPLAAIVSPCVYYMLAWNFLYYNQSRWARWIKVRLETCRIQQLCYDFGWSQRSIHDNCHDSGSSTLSTGSVGYVKNNQEEIADWSDYCRTNRSGELVICTCSFETNQQSDIWIIHSKITQDQYSTAVTRDPTSSRISHIFVAWNFRTLSRRCLWLTWTVWFSAFPSSIFSIVSTIAAIPAFEMIENNCAPDIFSSTRLAWKLLILQIPDALLTMSLKSTSSSKFIFLDTASRIFVLEPTSSPGFTSTNLSNLPGVIRELSSRSGRLVAPITNTLVSGELCNLSNSASSCETIRSMTPPESPFLPRFGAKLSISSKKMTHGDACLALSNTFRRFSSLWPTYLFSSSGPFTDRKAILNSVATAFAINVFPHPGDP